MYHAWYCIRYTWGTHTALRPFCDVCGILSYYIPRSNPDGVAISVTCMDWPLLTSAAVAVRRSPARAATQVSPSLSPSTAQTADDGGGAQPPPRVTVIPYDGVHWEQSHTATGIEGESKSKQPNIAHAAADTQRSRRHIYLHRLAVAVLAGTATAAAVVATGGLLRTKRQ